MNPGYLEFLKADLDDRRDVFLGAARRIGTPAQNVEKDFWVCWTLDALFNGRELAAGVRRSEAVALCHPIMPVGDCFGGRVVRINSRQL